MKNILIIVVLIFLNITELSAIDNKYPNIDLTYTKQQLEAHILKYQLQKDTVGLAYTYWAYSKNQEKGEFLNESPLVNLRKSMEFFKALKDSSNYYNTKGAIGSYFMDRPFIKKYAKEYIENATSYFKKTNDYHSEIGHLINLANIIIHENNFEPALLILNRCDSLNKLIKVDEFGYFGRIQSSYADIYARQGKFEKAIEYSNSSLKIAREKKIEWLEGLSLYILGRSMEGLKKYDKMLAYLMQSLEVTKRNINHIQLRKEVYESLKNYYLLKNNPKMALEYTIKAKESIEIIYFSKIESDLRSFSEYQLIEEQRMIISKIALDKKLVEVENDKLKSKQKLYLIAMLVGLSFLILLAILFINWRRVVKLKAIQTNKNIHIETLNALINGQELERVRVAQELHDGLGTMLSRMKIMVGKGADTIKINQMIDETCTEVRVISGNLQPNSLANFGLIKAVEELVNKQKSTTPNIIFQYFGQQFELVNKKALMVYRIIQELLANSLKHANSEEILVQLIFGDDKQLTLTVEDDGVGFDENNIKNDSSGWSNIRSRVNFLEGFINLHTHKNSGTSVTISIPNTEN